jgi:hypothetical protein
MKRIKMKMKVIFSQYWTLATSGFSEMKLEYRAVSRTDMVSGAAGKIEVAYLNTFLRIAKGNGRIRSMKRAISATRSRKTWKSWSAWIRRRRAFAASQLDREHAGKSAYQGVVERHLGLLVAVCLCFVEFGDIVVVLLLKSKGKGTDLEKQELGELCRCTRGVTC